jgi:oligopeptide transport system ATP-binding protein
MKAALLSVRDLKVHFPHSIGSFPFAHNIPLKAVDGISFDIAAGETLGIVGESGCGKSTLGRAILQLIEPTAGQVLWLGNEITNLDNKAMRRHRRNMQIVFQDPLASLNPRMTVRNIIGEPLDNFERQMSKPEKNKRVAGMMEKIGLSPQMMNRYPHEFSGGQCQRIGIGRAMILNPRIVICDEPVSALDVSIQAQIINLLVALQREFQTSLIFISHDLSVVRHISHRIMVMYLGRVMEIATRETLYDNPRHPYTRALISAVPLPDPEKEKTKKKIILSGDLPSPINPPSGCVFRTRCPIATEFCAQHTPELESLDGDGEVACHHYEK